MFDKDLETSLARGHHYSGGTLWIPLEWVRRSTTSICGPPGPTSFLRMLCCEAQWHCQWLLLSEFLPQPSLWIFTRLLWQQTIAVAVSLLPYQLCTGYMHLIDQRFRTTRSTSEEQTQHINAVNQVNQLLNTPRNSSLISPPSHRIIESYHGVTIVHPWRSQNSTDAAGTFNPYFPYPYIIYYIWLSHHWID